MKGKTKKNLIIRKGISLFVELLLRDSCGSWEILIKYKTFAFKSVGSRFQVIEETMRDPIDLKAYTFHQFDSPGLDLLRFRISTPPGAICVLSSKTICTRLISFEQV